MADRREFDIDGKPLSSLRVVDLKQELEKRGMSKSGSKKELSDRLKVQLQLEKLHESASTDEGHVPNLRLQDDEIAEHSDLIKDYLAKQQQIYEIQKEAIRRVELEEQRVRESSEASAGDTSQGEDELEMNRPKPEEEEPCAEDLSVGKSKRKVGRKENKEKEEEDICDEISEVNLRGKDKAGEQKKTEDVHSVSVIVQAKELCADNVQSDAASAEVQEEAVREKENSASELKAPNSAPTTDDKMANTVSRIEPNIKENTKAEMQIQEISKGKECLAEEQPKEKLPHEIDENAAVVDLITLEVHVAPEDFVSLPESSGEMRDSQMIKKKSDSGKELSKCPESTKGGPTVSSGESTPVPFDYSTVRKKQVEVKTAMQEDESETIEKKVAISPKHRPKLKRSSGQGSTSSAKDEKVDANVRKSEGDVAPAVKESLIDSTSEPKDDAGVSIIAGKTRDASRVQSDETKEQSHRESPEAAASIKKAVGTKIQKSEKKDDGNESKEGSRRSPARKSLRSKSSPRARRRRRSSSTESSSNESSSSSRSKSRSRSKSSSSRSRSASPAMVKGKAVVSPSEESMETNEDSVSRPFPKQVASVDTEGEDKTREMDDSSSAMDTTIGIDKPMDSGVVDKLPEKELPPRIASRKISLSLKKADSESKENGSVDEEKPQRKRRWGGSGSVSTTVGKKLSLSISTDSLKGLIPDVKPLATLNAGVREPLTEPSVDKNATKPSESVPAIKDDPATPTATTPISAPASKRDLIIYRTVTQVVKDNLQSKFPERDNSKGKLVVKNSTSIGYNDDAGAARRSPSPPRYPPSCIIHIRNLVRPFTDILLKELLSRTGTLVEGGFWMDKIKSKCYATFETEEHAVATRHALHGVQWPYSNPKRLSVDFATQDELEFHRNLTDNPDIKRVVPIGGNFEAAKERVQKSPPPLRRKEATAAVAAAPVGRQRKDSHKSDREKDKDKRDQKHGANRLQVEGRPERSVGGHEREAERPRGRDRDVTSGQHQHPIREWDRDKIGEKSPGERARAARNRGRSPLSRSRSRSKAVRSPPADGFGRQRERNREADVRDRRDRKERRKDEEEAPAKLLDDLFHKTKTTPCIYWLPLTGEQIKSREDERRQRQEEREKRRQKVEQTERDRSTGGAHVEPPKRNRENDNSRNRKRSESPARSRTRRR